MLRQIVARIEPADPARPENVEFRHDCVGIVQGHDAEVERVWLMLDRHEQRGPAPRAERPRAEAAGADAADAIGARGGDPVAAHHAREGHRRSAALELASPAVAPAAVERLALELVAHPTAHASAGFFRHPHAPWPLIDYERGAPYIAAQFPGASAEAFALSRTRGLLRVFHVRRTGKKHLRIGQRPLCPGPRQICRCRQQPRALDFRAFGR